MHGQLAMQFAETARQLQHPGGVKDVVEVVLDLASMGMQCRHVGLVASCTRARPEQLGVTDSMVEEAERLRLEFDGPHGSPTVRIEDTSSDPRWRQCDCHLVALGFHSVLTTQVGEADSPLGELTMYDEVPGWFTTESVAVAEIIARHAAVALSKQEYLKELRDGIRRAGQ